MKMKISGGIPAILNLNGALFLALIAIVLAEDYLVLVLFLAGAGALLNHMLALFLIGPLRDIERSLDDQGTRE